MAKTVSWAKGLSSILFWSIISAAFIGPGTVTTASKAGASFGIGLLWALIFSIIATVVLQEAAARITLASGKNLGQIIGLRFRQKRGLHWLVFLAIAFGCAAYQAGNILGAISGLLLFTTISPQLGTLLIALVCFGFLWIGNYKIIARLLGVVVALMGILFIYVATYSTYSLTDIISASVLPTYLEGSGLLIIGLIGTTIVPYNLFLGSGISKGQSIKEMRIGLIIAILIGGLISVAILLAGTQVEGDFSFSALAATLSDRVGKWGLVFFGMGLFSAGLSSSITSPLAAAVTAQSLLGQGESAWSARGKYFRLVWGAILLVGLVFGLLEVKPIPAIILAQAINGALLPLVAIFLFLIANDKKIIGHQFTNGWLSNVLTLLIVGLSCFLGLNNVVKAFGNTFGLVLGERYFLYLIILSIIIVILLFWLVFIKQDKPSAVEK
ncbi:MAG TPA: divalent metal cation transporter [Saprospiraceae bacterium]|nr:divalent metal cation transporter [Saprospiraceae bacterium]